MARGDWYAAAAAAGLAGAGLYLTVGGGGTALMNVWNISRLEPETRARAQLLLDWLAEKGWKPRITSTARDEEQQAKNVAAGKSAASISWHFSGRAFDILLFNPRTGRYLETPTAAEIEEFYRPAHQKWAELDGQGLAFGPYPDGPVRMLSGTRGKFWDGGHFEFHGPFLTAADAYRASSAMA